MSLHRLPFYLLLAAVALSPLPFGAVQIGAWSLLALAAGLAMLGWAAAAVLDRATPAHVGRLAWPIAAFALAVAWILLQLSPLTPDAWHHPIWAMAGDALGEPIRGRVAIDVEAGWFALIRLLSYAAIFWLAAQYGSDPKLAERALGIFTVAGAFAAGLGLLLGLAGLTKLLWFDEGFLVTQLRYGSRLAIPFVNPNHLSSFAGMGLICAIGLIVGRSRGLWRPDTAPREKLRRFIEAVVSRQWPLLVAAVIYAAAVAFSQSRGGAVALLAGLIVLWAALIRRSRPRISRTAGAAILLVAVAGLLFAPTVARFADRVGKVESESVQRLEIYRNATSAIEASPLLGYGLGSFPALYRMYDRNDTTGVVEFAHSTVLETIVELGIPAALLLFGAILWIGAACWRGAGARRRDQHFPALAAGVAAAAIIHSMVDFPLQIPAIAAAFSLVLGLGFSQASSSHKSSKSFK
ncbi:O-antigen ligase family protein [Emcibacter sp. SYSU 3D8]|uniref:O-antigen ligase family protein n=1 Tax=Emcibacter sp. SYSU 3D8 TaxID=3133969 RepID=UPI0031FEAF2C